MTKLRDASNAPPSTSPPAPLDAMDATSPASDLARSAVALASDRMATDILVLDLSERTSITDYFVLCTGRSDVQVQAICQRIIEGLREQGQRPLSTEGLENGQWALLDYGDVIIHVFQKACREHYDLEKLWSEAPRWTYDVGAVLSVQGP